MALSSLNHTQVPNEFIDEYIPKLSAKAGIIFLIICRKTIGWHKVSDRISFSQLEKMSGMVKSSVQLAVKELEDQGLILKERVKSGNIYDVNFNVDAVHQKVYEEPEGVPNNGIGIPINGTPGIPPIGNTKDNKTKETITKEKEQPSTKGASAGKPAVSIPKGKQDDILHGEPTPQAALIKAFSGLYEKSTGHKFNAAGEDFILAARLIKKFGLDDVINKCGILFEQCQSQSAWFTKEGMAAFTIKTLSTQWNGIIPVPKKKSANERAADEFERRHADDLKGDILWPS